MKRIEGQTFFKATITIGAEECEYVKCKFVQCNFVFTGESFCNAVDCEFEPPNSYKLASAAARTVDFLATLYQDPHTRPAVQKIIDDITGKHTGAPANVN